MERQALDELARRASLPLIAGLGLALRLFQLGRDSFWCDEAGVADIAALPTVGQALAAMRRHVLAMPLDYLLSWLAARFGSGEFIQRLPAALWGALALIACCLLGGRLLPAGARGAAGLAALLLALSPLHIEYSQELRFYAALVFWHALALWLFLRALDSGRRRDFALCAAAGLTGVFFHIYVALAALPMLGWALGAGRRDGDGAAKSPGRLRPALAAIGVIAAGAALGYRLFAGEPRADVPLFGAHPPLATLGYGMGWLIKPYGASGPAAHIWGAACFGLYLLGLGRVVRGGHGRLRILVLAGYAQIGLILAADALAGYWFIHRQLLHLLPVNLLVSALGGLALREMIIKRWPGVRRTGPAGAAAALALVALISLPALISYYGWTKSRAREVTAAVSADWRPGDTLLLAVVPDGCDDIMYDYYLTLQGAGPAFDASLPIGRDELLAQAAAHRPAAGGATFLALAGPLGADEWRALLALGFRPQSAADRPDSRVQILLANRARPAD